MNCPVCGVKIKPWDWRQNCAACGTNLFLHDFNKRLEEQSVQAEKDFLWWNNMTAQFMDYGVRDKISLTRMILSVLPLLLIPAPAVLADGKLTMFLSFVSDVMGGGKIFPEGFGIADIFSYKGLGIALPMLALSLLMATLAFFSVIVGPAFMNFRAPAVFESIGAVFAVVGTAVFNFVFIPSAQGLLVPLESSFGLYIYCALMIGECIFLFWFTKYAKKFPALQ